MISCPKLLEKPRLDGLYKFITGNDAHVPRLMPSQREVEVASGSMEEYNTSRDELLCQERDINNPYMIYIYTIYIYTHRVYILYMYTYVICKITYDIYK